MDYRSLHMKTVVDLKKIAKENGVKIPAGTNKAALVERILEKMTADAAAQQLKEAPAAKVAEEVVQANERDAETGEGAEKAAMAQPAASYVRPLNTQQRMGARTKNPANPSRMQQRGANPAARAPGRFVTESFAAHRNVVRKGGAADDVRQGVRGEEENLRGSKTEDRMRMPAACGADMQDAAAADAPNHAQTHAAENQAVSRDRAEKVSEDARYVNPGASELMAAGECSDGAGILEIHPEGYGFLRAENYLPGNRDVYVSAAQIRRFNLRTGDHVLGKTRPQQLGDRSVGLIYINEINGQSPERARRRRPFDSLVPVYPNRRLRMETGDRDDVSMRLIDLIAPIGKGQRGMIVSPPKAGKTTLLKRIARAITQNDPDVHLIVLLIDERPEEVTDMKRSIQGEVVYSTFDEAPENHTRVSEMVLERAQRLVELGKDVVVLLDSITRLARAYNLVIPPTGRSLSGGLDPGALYKPKRFFGAARNIENGGSLTIIATALVDTGSRMDDIIFEEFKGTGNMELHLDRSLSDRRIFPAIDLYRSGTRREELLMTPEELEGSYQLRRMLSRSSSQEAAEQLLNMVVKAGTNAEFYQKLKSWKLVCEKDGYTR